MTEQKMSQIDSWMQHMNQNELDGMDIKDQLDMAKAIMEMMEKMEPVYDKYNGGNLVPGIISGRL